MSLFQTGVRREIQITNALGLHLRPALKFVRTADAFGAEIRIWHRGEAFDGRSILDLAGLAAERGTTLELEAIGPDAEAALAALAELVAAEFYEDEYGEERPPGVPSQPGLNGTPPPAGDPGS